MGVITVLTELQFSEARRDLSALYDVVSHSLKPALIRRRRTEEEVLLLRRDLARQLLRSFSLKLDVVYEKDGSVTLALDQLDLVVNGSTLEEAVNDLVRELKLYCQDYLERMPLFINAPNRRDHFPYILRIALCENDAEIRDLLELPCPQGSGS